MNLYHETNFPFYSLFTVYYNYTKIGRFIPILSIRIVLSCFYLLISHFENFPSWILHLLFAVNGMLNLSIINLFLVNKFVIIWRKQNSKNEQVGYFIT